jgi:hypothetical protein
VEEDEPVEAPEVELPAEPEELLPVTSELEESEVDEGVDP